MSKDVTTLEWTYAWGNLDSSFNQSSWSQTVREHPLESLAIAAGATALGVTVAGAAILAATGLITGTALAGVSAFAGSVVTSAAVGGLASNFTAAPFANAIYHIAASGQCGPLRQQQIMTLGRDAFINKARENASLYGVLYGAAFGAGPIGQITGGTAGALQGAAGIDKARNGGFTNPNGSPNICNIVDALLGSTGVLSGALAIKQGINGFSLGRTNPLDLGFTNNTNLTPSAQALEFAKIADSYCQYLRQVGVPSKYFRITIAVSQVPIEGGAALECVSVNSFTRFGTKAPIDPIPDLENLTVLDFIDEMASMRGARVVPYVRSPVYYPGVLGHAEIDLYYFINNMYPQYARGLVAPQ